MTDMKSGQGRIGRRALVRGSVLGTLAFAAAPALRNLGVSADETTRGQDPAKPVWSYEGAEAPEFWGDIVPEFSACGMGKEQSPINLNGAMEADLPEITFAEGGMTGVTAVNNGHTIKVSVPAGDTITIDGTDYVLVEFHFHTPSEHYIDGVIYPMEVHLVHKSAGGELAVLGVMLKQGPENAMLKQLFAALPTANTELALDGVIDIAQLIPADHTTYRYAGSLTTPPCTEGVRWHVFAEPMTLSVEQIEAYQALFPMDARPLQSLNGREIMVGE